MSNHTPGPWTHIPRARDGHADKIAAKNGAEFISVGSPVAEYPILDAPHENTQTANARLVAAAPDLLTSAQDALELWDDLYSNMCENDEDDGERNVFRALREAIRKATGEQP